jgi:copper chaperone
MKEATFKVPEMSCGHCKAAIEGELGRLSGVERSNADLEKGVVEVRYDEGLVSTDELKGAIEDAGYIVAA